MPRKGPRRPLFSARVDEADQQWVQERAEQEGVLFPVFARRVLTFARLSMPVGWQPPAAQEVETSTEEPEL